MSGALIETSARRLRNEAVYEASKKMAVKLLKRGKLTLDEISEDTGLSVTEIEKLVELHPV